MASVRHRCSAIGLLVMIVVACTKLVEAGPSFKALPASLIVSASIPANATEERIRATIDEIVVSWSLNTSFAGMDGAYKSVIAKLCYAPISQLNRKWRKGNDDLAKDKTCGHKIGSQPYTPAGGVIRYIVASDVPRATYFIRMYALDGMGLQVARGSTTNANKTSNLFKVQGISGRTVSIDVAAGMFAAFSLISLFGFFFFEKKLLKKSD